MNQKYGLVLEGGGLRGCYTAGALQWLLDHNLHFEYVAAISAGSVYGLFYLGEMRDTLHDFSIYSTTDAKMKGLYPLLHEGCFIGYDYIIQQYAKPSYAKAVEVIRNKTADMEYCLYNMTKEKLEYFNKSSFDDQLLHLKASCTLPVSGKMVQVDGEKFLDGGIEVMIPIERSIQTGHIKNLIITTKDEHYVRKPYSPTQLFMLGLVYGKYPTFRQAIARRTDQYYRQMGIVQEQVDKGAAVWIRPSKDMGIGRFKGTKEQLEKMFELGYQDMEERKDEILAFLHD